VRAGPHHIAAASITGTVTASCPALFGLGRRMVTSALYVIDLIVKHALQVSAGRCAFPVSRD
jgi:hypothetical protein